MLLMRLQKQDLLSVHRRTDIVHSHVVFPAGLEFEGCHNNTADFLSVRPVASLRRDAKTTGSAAREHKHRPRVKVKL